MARPRKPTAILELTGAFKKNPARKRERGAEPAGLGALGEPPVRMSVEAQAFWREIVAMVPASVLTSADRWAVELCATLMEKAVREDHPNALLEIIRSAELSALEVKALISKQSITGAELSTLRSLMAALGMTPADRSKLGVTGAKAEEQDEIAQLAAEARSVSVRPN